MGPWLFVVMINDLNVPGDLWKYVDGTTISEIIQRDETSHIQKVVDEFANHSKRDKFVLNESKCKELRISFAKSKDNFEPIILNNTSLDVVKHAKILGLNVSDNLKWNYHVEEIVKKASKRLYFLTQLKRSKVGSAKLVQFYKSCIRSLVEYACHDSLPGYLSNDLERIQRLAMHIIYPSKSYEQAISTAGLVSLFQRRQQITDKLFQQISKDDTHKLHELLPTAKSTSISLRNNPKFVLPKVSTDRFKNSFIISSSLKY